MNQMENRSLAKRCSFQYCLTHTKLSQDESRFPFAVSTMSGKNPHFEKDNTNCQDAAAICINPQYIAAVICDGCFSTHPSLEPQSVSSNEIGAKLASTAVLREIQNTLARKQNTSPTDLVNRISNRLMRSFRKTVLAFCGNDEDLSEKFIFDYLMTTVIGIVVTEREYVIFNSGDGVIAINGTFSILDGESGHYFSNNLLSICCPKRYPKGEKTSDLKVYSSGDVRNLQSLFIASDGFDQIVTKCPQEIANFAMRTTPREQCPAGFDFALQEFRKDIAWNQNISFDLSDDATFVLIRRTSQQSEASAC